MFKRIIADILLWTVTSTFYVLFRLVLNKQEVLHYFCLFGIMALTWVVLGFLFFKYRRSYKEVWFWEEILSLILTTTALYIVTHYGFSYLPYALSETVAQWMIGIMALVDAIVILGKHYWKFALNMTVPPITVEQRANAFVHRTPEQRSLSSIETIHQAVLSITTEEDYQLLYEKAFLDSRQTKVVANLDPFSIMQLPDYEYATIVDLTLLNDARGINRRFCMINQKLPDNGHYVCCYRPQEYIKKKMLERYPHGINYVIYTLWFIWKRVIPRLLLMSRLYYDLTKGRKRMLSKAEVLGRLYYCGFEVDEVIPMGHIEYVFAHRHSQPYPQEKVKLYGPLIKLPRVCKHQEIRYFYKFRTMHPYSEYIQKYVFDQRGGMNIADKSDDDWRITTWGRLMRKYWLDELPMLFNWLKRDVKLVGVRPLSQTMFATYPKDLQDKRTRVKPGLIPPFYIDHPKTFEELYASENMYLDEYLAHPFRTDVKYLFATIYSILFKKMRSA